MAGRCSLQHLLFTIVVTLLMLLSSALPSTSRRLPSKGVRGAYWPSWRRQSFPPSSIDPSLFTHVFYAFVLPDPSSYHLVITPDDDRDLPVFTATLHGHKPTLKALLSIGGANDRATAAFARMASDAVCSPRPPEIFPPTRMEARRDADTSRAPRRGRRTCKTGATEGTSVVDTPTLKSAKDDVKLERI